MSTRTENSRSEERKVARPNAFRTVFLLENSTALWSSAPGSFEPVSEESTLSSRSSATSFVAQTEWTWITWILEAVFEYCRIAWDIFPSYGVSIHGSGPNDETLKLYPTSGQPDQPSSSTTRFRDLRIAMSAVSQLERFAKAASMSISSAGSVFESIRDLENDELLSAPVYYENIENVSSDRPFYVRIVIVTTEKDELVLVNSVRESIMRQNIGYITRFEIAVFICSSPEAKAPSYKKIDGLNDAYITLYYISTGGTELLEAFKSCLAWDLRLSRTIVTDIPMREDVKTGGAASTSYNVDMFHPCLITEQKTQSRPGGTPLRMKWLKPVKGTTFAHVPLDDALPIRTTPSDPTTRPTQCLVGYVLDGNAVLLESQEVEKSGVKICKLFLSGGKICLLQLKSGTERVVDDIPSLLEVPGGKVTNYRVKEMCTLLKTIVLDPKSQFPIPSQALSRQKKMTSYFPFIYSDSLAYLLPQFVPLFEVVASPEKKDRSEWHAARNAIEEVLDMNAQNTLLPGLNTHVVLSTIPSGTRRAESYAVLWVELDMILEAYSNSSEGDSVRSLRDYLHARLPTPLRSELRTLILDRVRRHSYPGSNTENRVGTTVPENTTEGAQGLYKRKARPEFEGRLKFGRMGKLYQNLQKLEKGQREDTTLIHASLEL
ncbi:hypothetical protein RvY_10645 [Ramazzottius varieornatus]|uniref:Protein asunder n=1 Tax=Ramazzottius varieornatus TaxID=947166 RepID=A0A1D1VDF2_RAMVA|nr:hypothetical protein RvY_10645 [Ramazzottius varieornatus]